MQYMWARHVFKAFQWFSFKRFTLLNILFAVLQVHAGPYIKCERFVEGRGRGRGGGLTCPGCSQGVWNSACWHISFTFLYLGRLLVCCVLAESSFFLRIFLPDARGRLARRRSRAGAISPSLAPGGNASRRGAYVQEAGFHFSFFDFPFVQNCQTTSSANSERVFTDRKTS